MKTKRTDDTIPQDPKDSKAQAAKKLRLLEMPEEESSMERGEVGHEPAWNASAAPAHETVIPHEPKTGELPPLQESVPYETERRAYSERRRPTNEKWVGLERRSGQDRRNLSRVTTEPLPAQPADPSTVPVHDDEIHNARGKEADVWPWRIEELHEGIKALWEVVKGIRIPSYLRRAALRVEVLKISAWMVALVVIPSAAFLKFGFQVALVTWFLLVAAFFVTLFFHLNRK